MANITGTCEFLAICVWKMNYSTTNCCWLIFPQCCRVIDLTTNYFSTNINFINVATFLGFCTCARKVTQIPGFNAPCLWNICMAVEDKQISNRYKLWFTRKLGYCGPSVTLSDLQTISKLHLNKGLAEHFIILWKVKKKLFVRGRSQLHQHSC